MNNIIGMALVFNYLGITQRHIIAAWALAMIYGVCWAWTEHSARCREMNKR